ncbi:MAG: hypothetical protein CL819_09020 [Croceicoccus sp.]|nr:hypothetical protein [Croceicoccus sp.]
MSKPTHPDDELVTCPACEATGKLGDAKCPLCRPNGERYTTGKVGTVRRSQAERFKAAAAIAMLEAVEHPTGKPDAITRIDIRDSAQMDRADYDRLREAIVGKP